MSETFYPHPEKHKLIDFDCETVAYFRRVGFFEKYRALSDRELTEKCLLFYMAHR